MTEKNPPAENVLTIENLEKTFNAGKRNAVHVLKGISLQMQQGDFFTLMGPSGSGKSTLLNIVGGLIPSSQGLVKIKGTNIYALSDDRLSEIRAHQIGWIFQYFGLIDNLTALENVIIPLHLAGVEDEAAKNRALELLRVVELEGRKDHFPDSLSGGQQQRVAIARALANNPDLLLADEPTGNLDTRTGREIIALFRKLATMGKTILMVTHDIRLAHTADQVFILRNGLIEKEMDGSKGI